MSLKIDRFDHIVLNVADVQAGADWYARVLGMEREEFASRTGPRLTPNSWASATSLMMLPGGRCP